MMHRFHRGIGFLSVVALLLCAAASAQEAPPPPADPSDVSSIDAIMTAVYDVISGPAGEKRDWGRFRSLFVSGARLIPVALDQNGERMEARMLSPEGYTERSRAYLEENGFFEKEIHRVVEQFGPIAHVFSTYESRHTAEDAEPFARGINSFQLLNDGDRWWVVTIYWTGESPELPIPAKYLETVPGVKK
jgi:hypothetical protein